MQHYLIAHFHHHISVLDDSVPERTRPLMHRLLHLIGPGGAGKTTVGAMLADKLGWQFIDLDERFMAQQGDISLFIQHHGYQRYARCNVELYATLKSSLLHCAVFVLSSGFMTYDQNQLPTYPDLFRTIEHDPLTALLLPSFELEECVEIVVKRQLSRPWLADNGPQEERKIRQRFATLRGLGCRQFESKLPVHVLVEQIWKATCLASPINNPVPE